MIDFIYDMTAYSIIRLCRNLFAEEGTLLLETKLKLNTIILEARDPDRCVDYETLKSELDKRYWSRYV